MKVFSGTAKASVALLGEARAQQLVTAAERVHIRARSLATQDGRTSSRRLAEYRNKFRGHRAVIIGNGPSLRRTDLALLKNEFTFGLNRVYLLFDELGFQTSFLVSINELLISQVADELAGVHCPKFLRWSCRKMFRQQAEHAVFLQSRRTPSFAADIGHGLWEGATVTYVAMQLAFHMGFTKVVLVGVDHNFVTQGPANEVVESSGPDPNHFHPEYFGRGFRWQLPDLETSEYAYRLAQTAYEAAGRQIINATVGGKLGVFPRLDLDAALLA